ncbi:hypothetical protein ASF21_12780 [Arthrobacter sp. Leaf234]|uniref:hypothetical protein n=1 Tax=Arthrobacter sp. Leaf234 TaxID=1736303 RepID=UPI0006FFBC01|nr:hypothetical protein [Arthrobacter sp. Leaf234]KQN99676.1 hypothetical protein ASF21_12780 [Arthrobacter sp. Leaf234]
MSAEVEKLLAELGIDGTQTIAEAVAAVQALNQKREQGDGLEHLWLSDLRRHPNGEVRLYSSDGKLISGTYTYQVTASVDAMVRAAARR